MLKLPKRLLQENYIMENHHVLVELVGFYVLSSFFFVEENEAELKELKIDDLGVNLAC